MLQASYAAGKLRGSVRRASGLVLTGDTATLRGFEHHSEAS